MVIIFLGTLRTHAALPGNYFQNTISSSGQLVRTRQFARSVALHARKLKTYLILHSVRENTQLE